MEAELKAYLDEMRAGLTHDMADLKRDMADVKRDMTDLKHDMVEVKRDVTDLKHDMVEVKRDVTDLKREMADVRTRVRSVELKIENEVIPKIEQVAEGVAEARQHAEHRLLEEVGAFGPRTVVSEVVVADMLRRIQRLEEAR